MNDDDRIERLDETECWRILSEQKLGRLATTAGGVLDIFPVNYHADGQTVLFRTAPGDKLLELTIHDHVVFEVDGFDERSGWSVVVKGAARALDRGHEIETADAVGLTSWLPTEKQVYVRIVPSGLTGRRFTRADASSPSLGES